MFNIFKTKEQKAREKKEKLEKKLEEFRTKYESYFNSYCYDGQKVVIYGEPLILDGKLYLQFVDADTPEGFYNYAELWWFQFKFGEDFVKQDRIRFVKLKEQLQKLGVSMSGFFVKPDQKK